MLCRLAASGSSPAIKEEAERNYPLEGKLRINRALRNHSHALCTGGPRTGEGKRESGGVIRSLDAECISCPGRVGEGHYSP